ncbi:3-hydroxybutyryl-CoA dehydrogenase [Risungbinella massiliensis]|uniref:3-hydroxybutyryl-CoA dehydrogenase n=1 Tax=Risungbinella massiliensis TaxID=1329796 RepID=UPI0005CC811D|nr:3-hydroxybutyryl-CoA dehydrogenase [Risungbinella massiliensis]
MSLQHIGVVGAGQMGSGIAQVFAQAGFQVTLVDTQERFLARGIDSIQKSLARFVQKGMLSEEEKEATLARIKTTIELTPLSQVDLVVEAIVEQMDAKAKLFSQLDQICPASTILASNTSSLPITEIAAVTNRPAKVIGMHFMNPVPVMKLVEIIRGLATSDEVYETIHQLTEKLGKHPVEVQDFPGFVSNRILMPMVNEAIYSVYEGVATPEAVDAVMKLGMNHPMGPLQLADMIGLDTCLYIMETLQDGFGDSKYRPCPLLRKYVKAGWLGRKSGRGFYQYS